MDDYVSIGFTKKPYGIKGELKLKILDAYLEDFARAEVLFLGIDGRKIPFFVEAVRMDGPLLIKFEEKDTKESASQLAGKEIFLRELDLSFDEKRKNSVADLKFTAYVGYILEDVNFGKIGTIKEVIEYPQQEMAIVLYKEKERLIPLNEHLVVRIDKDEQKILLDLPEGLLELND